MVSLPPSFVVDMLYGSDLRLYVFNYDGKDGYNLNTISKRSINLYRNQDELTTSRFDIGGLLHLIYEDRCSKMSEPPVCDWSYATVWSKSPDERQVQRIIICWMHTPMDHNTTLIVVRRDSEQSKTYVFTCNHRCRTSFIPLPCFLQIISSHFYNIFTPSLINTPSIFLTDLMTIAKSQFHSHFKYPLLHVQPRKPVYVQTQISRYS